ncbi:MAG TPA: pyridoxal-phosphate dependent enzyme [Desulfuromonadales bacterium]|nr:pyridoxal-phosphate dependent enzyme [Desulfuromonadales bacterium]
MIDLKLNDEQLQKTVALARERKLLIPTLAQQKDPNLIPDRIKARLKDVGLWDIDPLNLFRITWKNQPTVKGGGFGGVNYIEIPQELSGVKARIIALIGKWFPTGAHKVGATFGCLVPPLVTGQFDPTSQKAVWPSTGNFCRGGAYNATLLGCESIAILPEEMSRERFNWLATVAGEVIATPGCESNVKEIFDKCWELRQTREDIRIFNQFEEFGNYLWHYEVTGHAIEDVIRKVLPETGRFAGFVSQTGSGGTIAAGDYLKQVYPTSRIVASEALQCPTLLKCGYGAHRIEGIGDKHIPWVHNVRNTDMVTAIDDTACMHLIRLFNEPQGRAFLAQQRVAEDLISSLDLIGISGVGNLLSAIKMAKYYELTGDDLIVTVCTDSMDLYQTRLDELTAAHGEYSGLDAAVDYQRYLLGEATDNLKELTYQDRRQIHNLKYFTWVEQQGKDLEELDAQWYDRDYWTNIHSQTERIDRLIEKFNEKVDMTL